MLRLAFLLLAAFAALLAVPAQAEDVPECRDPAYLMHFYVSVPAGASCELVAQDRLRWNGHSAKIRMIHLRGTSFGDSGAWATGLSEVASAASAAMTRLGPDVMIDPVTIYLGDTISPPMEATTGHLEAGAAGAIALPPTGGECPVYFYKAMLGRDRAHTIDTLVHELFHCIQYKRWGGSMTGVDAWITEGSAEYFVYLARPSRGPDDIQSFDGSIGGASLGALTYNSVPFFLWLGDRDGPPAVLRFISHPRPISAMIDPAMWRAFGERYFAEAVHMPDGTPMPSRPRFQSVTVSNAMQLRFVTLAPYTLQGAEVSFAREKVYRLALPPLAPEFFLRAREGSNEWADLPSEIDAGCSAKPYRVIWGSSGAAETVEGRVTARPVPPGSCTCPAGVWQESPDSTRRYFEQSVLGGRKRFVGGTRSLTLNADHTGSFSYNAIEVISGEGTPMILDQVQTGVSTFTWKVVGGKLLTVLTGGSGRLTLNNTLTINGSVRHEVRQSAMQTIGHDFSCDSAGLHLTVPAHTPLYLPPGMSVNFSPNMDFVRGGG